MDESTDKYYLEKMINNIVLILEQSKGMSLEDYENNELVSSSISFKFVQIAENMTHLSDKIINENDAIPWTKIKGMRNKIVHDYGNIVYYVIYNTINNDLPNLLDKLKSLLEKCDE